MTAVKKEFKFGDHVVTLETGEIARQATGAVMISMGETVVLVTAVAEKSAAPGRDFFPLTVNYQEKTYAVGRIPGGFLKREGRPALAGKPILGEANKRVICLGFGFHHSGMSIFSSSRLLASSIFLSVLQRKMRGKRVATPLLCLLERAIPSKAISKTW